MVHIFNSQLAISSWPSKGHRIRPMLRVAPAGETKRRWLRMNSLSKTNIQSYDQITIQSKTTLVDITLPRHCRAVLILCTLWPTVTTLELSGQIRSPLKYEALLSHYHLSKTLTWQVRGPRAPRSARRKATASMATCWRPPGTHLVPLPLPLLSPRAGVKLGPAEAVLAGPSHGIKVQRQPGGRFAVCVCRQAGRQRGGRPASMGRWPWARSRPTWEWWGYTILKPSNLLVRLTHLLNKQFSKNLQLGARVEPNLNTGAGLKNGNLDVKVPDPPDLLISWPPFTLTDRCLGLEGL